MTLSQGPNRHCRRNHTKSWKTKTMQTALGDVRIVHCEICCRSWTPVSAGV